MDIQNYIDELLAYWAPGIELDKLADEVKARIFAFARYKTNVYKLHRYEEEEAYGSPCLGGGMPVCPPEPCPADSDPDRLMECCLMPHSAPEVSDVCEDAEEEHVFLSKTSVCEIPKRQRKESEQQRIKREIEERLERLRELGITDQELSYLFRGTVHISPVLVTRDGRIVLTDYDNREVEMGLIEKTLYLLFLRHPEGLYQKDLIDYAGELQDLYRKVNGGTITPRGMSGIGRLINPLDNSCDEKLSHIRKAFSSMFQPVIADTYSVTRGKGELRRIPIESNLITWEQ